MAAPEAVAVAAEASAENTPSVDEEAASNNKSVSEQSEGPTIEKQVELPAPQQQPGINIFAKLFQRSPTPKKEEVTLANGNEDLLDDERSPENDNGPVNEEDKDGDSATHDESSAESVSSSDDETSIKNQEEEDGEDESSDSGEDKEDASKSEGETHVESFHEDSKFQKDAADENQQDEEDDCDDDDFGDYAQDANNYHGNDKNEDVGGGEMYSLIDTGSPTKGDARNNGAAESNNENGLGASISKFFGIKPKEQEQKEWKGLLMGNETESENDDDASIREDANRDGQSPQRSGSGPYCDNTGEGNDFETNYHDDRSEPGEYRLESFYPADSCGDDDDEQSYHTESRDLYGRIRGFSNGSPMARQGGNMDNGSRSGFSRDAMSGMPMTSMDIESSDERGNFLDGVGKAVNNITDFIRHQREGDNQADKERKRMLDYIGDLEWKLSKKDKEVQSWKERAEQLQVQVNQLQSGSDDDDDDDDEEEDEEATLEELESGEEEQQEVERSEHDTEPQSSPQIGDDDMEDTNVKQEGTLIDITPKPLVFDPLLAVSGNGKEHQVDDDLMDRSKYDDTLRTAASTFSEQEPEEDTTETKQDGLNAEVEEIASIISI